MRLFALIAVLSLLGIAGCTKTIHEASVPADASPAQTSADTFSA